MLHKARHLAAAAAVAVVLGVAAKPLPTLAADQAAPLLNDPNSPFSLEVSEVSAKVGEVATLQARLRLRDQGLRVLEHYNNRVSRLTTEDKGVTFPRKMVLGDYRDGELVFSIPVQPTKPGRHAINGVFRVGYAEDSTTMRMITVPLMTGVTGTE